MSSTALVQKNQFLVAVQDHFLKRAIIQALKPHLPYHFLEASQISGPEGAMDLFYQYRNTLRGIWMNTHFDNETENPYAVLRLSNISQLKGKIPIGLSFASLISLDGFEGPIICGSLVYPLIRTLGEDVMKVYPNIRCVDTSMMFEDIKTLTLWIQLYGALHATP